MNNQLIPVFAGEISGAPVKLVDASLLHSFLEVTTKFADWIKRRIDEYDFVENVDFLLLKFEKQTGRGGHNKTDYHLTLDMAKELGMIERSEKGRQIRRYFLEMEKIAHQHQYGLKALPSEPLQKTTKALPGCLTLETQDEIKQLIHDRVALLPKDQQAKAAISMWSALGTHFGIKKEKGDKIPAYKRIPEGARLECLSLLARLSVDDLVTLTQDEYNAIKKALPKPEQLVDPSANTFNLSIGKGSNLTNISIKFNTCDRFYDRWFVTISEGVLMVRPMEMDEISMTFQQWIKHATQEKGYIVVKKSELLDKLTD